MARIDGAVITAKMLKEAGVECVFTLSGGHIFRIFQECEKQGIHVYDVRNEMSAAYAAMAYAQASGKMGVVITTAGPGVTNTVTAMVDSKLVSAPVMLIGGAAAVRQELTETLQEYDTVSIMKPLTKWAGRCSRIENLPRYMSTAIRACRGLNCGPVYIEIPMDVLEYETLEEHDVIYPKNYLPNHRTGASPEAVAAIGDMLLSANHPVIMVGDGNQYYVQDKTAFSELAEYLMIPADFGWVKGHFASEANFLFKLGLPAVAKADLLLLFNYSTELANASDFSPSARIININTDSTKVGLNTQVAIGVTAHSDVVARQVLDYVKTKTEQRFDNPWLIELGKEGMAAIPLLDAMAFQRDDLTPMHPARLANEVQKFVNAEGAEYCHVTDGGDCLTWEIMGTALKTEDPGAFPGRFFYGTKFAGIGFGFGVALGVYAATKRPILFSTGDGSFGQFIGEMLTYAKHKVPITVLISNDANFGMITAFAQNQTPLENNDIGQVIGDCDGNLFRLEKIADAWGGYGEFVTDPEEIYPALVRASQTDKPSIVNVHVICRQDCFSMGTMKVYERLTTM